LLLSSTSSGSDFFVKGVSKFFSWILDFTASHAFAQSLVDTEIDPKTTTKIFHFVVDGE